METQVPTYDFTCISCDVTKEIQLSFEDNIRPTCDKCGEFLNKVFSAIPAHFKGGGWGAQ